MGSGGFYWLDLVWIGAASIRVATLDVDLSCCVASLGSSTQQKINCCCDDSRRDAQRRFTSIVLCVVPRFLMVWFGILSRCLLASCRIVSLGLSVLYIFCVCVETIGVVTLSVGLSASCRMAWVSLGSVWLGYFRLGWFWLEYVVSLDWVRLGYVTLR
jgi:hypothetical protein